MADDDGLGKIAMALGFKVKATPDLLMEGLKGNALSLQDFEIFMLNGHACNMDKIMAIAEK